MSCYIEELNANQTRYVVDANVAGCCGLAGHGCRSWQEEVNASQEFGRRSLQLYQLPAGKGAQGSSYPSLLQGLFPSLAGQWYSLTSLAFGSSVTLSPYPVIGKLGLRSGAVPEV